MLKFKNIFLPMLLFSFINSFSETINAKDIYSKKIEKAYRTLYEGKVLNGEYDIIISDPTKLLFNDYLCDNPMSVVSHINLTYNNGIMDRKTVQCYSYNDSILFETIKNPDSTITTKSYDITSRLRRIFNYDSSFIATNTSTFYLSGELFEFTSYDNKNKLIITTEYNKDKTIKKIKTFKNGKLKNVEIK